MRNWIPWAGPVLVGLWLGLSAMPAEAAAFRSGLRVVVPQGEVIDDDLYVVGGEVHVDGRITGDLIVAGGVVTVTGGVEGDLTGAAGDMAVTAPVGGAMRLAAAQLRLAAPVGGDLIVAAGELETQPALAVGGESLLWGAELRLDGRLGRALTASAGDLRLAGAVGGGATLEAPVLAIGPGARIEGPLLLRTAMPEAIAPSAVITGPVDQRLIEVKGFTQALWPWLLRLVMALLLGLTLLWLMPDLANRAAKAALSVLWLRFLAGLGLMIGAPLASIMLMLTVIGLPVGLLALGTYALCLYLTQLVVAWALGRWVLQRRFQVNTTAMRALALTLGLVAVSALKAIPVAGAYFTMAFVVWGLGAIGTVFYRSFRERHPV
ncbi:MAG: hypothetical protein ACLGIN_13825 [Candidatus Sericytochromatia bacterium]